MVANYQPTVLSGLNAQSARFGSSVVFGGDLDQNGFYDVIIGAPLEETSADSSGVIYVYYGSSKGLSEEQKQVNFIVSLLCATNSSKVTEIRGFKREPYQNYKSGRVFWVGCGFGRVRA